MNRLLASVVFASFLALPLRAQDNPKIEVFGGYQYLHAGNIDGMDNGVNANGWNASAAVNFSRHLGVAADFSGTYKSTILDNAGIHFHGYTYTFGPVASWDSGKNIKLFTHALFGGAHLTPTLCLFGGDPSQCSGDLSFTGFAMILGGGIDAGNRRVGFRLFQADWVYLPVQEGGHANNVRLSTGLVFRF
jgi:hypothetical protein